MSKLDQPLENFEDRSQRRGRGGRTRRRRSDDNFFDKMNGPKNPLSRDEDPSPSGPIRRDRRRYTGRTPYSLTENLSAMDDEEEWKHDLFNSYENKNDPSETIADNRIEAGNTILVSNLAEDVNVDDVKEMFSQVGDIVTAVVNYAPHGKSLGTANVTFATSAMAQRALQEYHGASVDGRPMYINIVGNLAPTGPTTVSTSAPLKHVVEKKSIADDRTRDRTYNSFSNGNRNRPSPRLRGIRARMTSSIRSRGRIGGGRGRSTRGIGRGRRGGTSKLTQQELDAELDDYHGKFNTDSGTSTAKSTSTNSNTSLKVKNGSSNSANVNTPTITDNNASMDTTTTSSTTSTASN